MKKRRLTRKRSALGWLAGLCLLVLLCDWLGLYGLTPRSALRQAERYFFTGETAVEAGFWGPGGERLLLSQNEAVVMVSLATWSPLRGFEAGFPLILERTDAPVDAGWGYYCWDAEENVYPSFVGGCVNDPRVTSLEVELRRLPEASPIRREDCPLLETLRAEPLGEYFLLDLGVRADMLNVGVWIVARDAAERELDCRRVDMWASLVEQFFR